MQFYTFILSLVATAAVAAGDPAGHEWQAPAADAKRSPCPMLNAVANHGYIPRSGQNVSLIDLHTGFYESVNYVADLLTIVGTVALGLSTTGNPLTFNLDDVAVHGVIEHDGSLSRKDAYFGDNLHFDAESWAQTAAYFTEDTVSVSIANEARKNRLSICEAEDPQYNLGLTGAPASIVDTALYQIILGDLVNGGPPKEWVRILFEEERIPFDEGFTRSDSPIDQIALDAMTLKVALA